MSEEYTPDLVTVTDDENKEHTFEILDRIETDDNRYIAVIPYSPSPEELLEDDGEIFILRVVEEDGKPFLEAIEDNEEFERIYPVFEERLADYLYEDESED